MDSIKDRYQFIIGFAAIIISLSSFKDELKAIRIDLGFFAFTAAQYLFYLTLYFVFVVHVYVIPYMLHATKYKDWKLVGAAQYIGYMGFGLAALSPTFIGITYLTRQAIIRIPSVTLNEVSHVMQILVIILFLFNLLLTNKLVVKYIRKRVGRNADGSLPSSDNQPAN